MKFFKKLFVCILISALIFCFSPVTYAGINFTRMVEEIIVETLLKVGDGIFYIVSTSVGELVTTDAIVYNSVDKININYWEAGGAGSVKSIMSEVVETWYPVFMTIAMVVYMVVLVFAGLQVLLHSTAEKKAQYKEYLVSWVMGVMILCLFPYVMKYTVKLNEAAVGAMASYVSYAPPAVNKPAILNDSSAAMKIFGKIEFVEKMTGLGSISTSNVSSITDPMLQTRAIAQLNVNFVLVVVYFILIGQMIVLLFVYYKRAFMLAFLITVFPLVAMTYAIDKMGDKKAQSFGIWFKEFVVNVIVQTFHAVVYVVLVNSSVSNYIATKGSNWLFMIISILFLFQGEKILRNIFNVNSSANTLGTLAATGAVMVGAASKLGGGKSSNDVASGQDAADSKAAGLRQTARTTMGAGGTSVPQVMNQGGGTTTAPTPSTQGPENAGQYRGNDPDGVAPGGFDLGKAQDTVLQGAMARRLKGGLARGMVKGAGRTVGGIMGATYGLSQGDTADGKMLDNAIGGTYAGATLGEGVVSPISAGVNAIERRVSGNKLAKQIESGKMDENLSLNVPQEALIPPDVNMEEIIGKHGESMQEIYRQALAEMARTTARKGKAKGEMAFWNYIEQNTKK